MSGRTHKMRHFVERERDTHVTIFLVVGPRRKKRGFFSEKDVLKSQFWRRVCRYSIQCVCYVRCDSHREKKYFFGKREKESHVTSYIYSGRVCAQDEVGYLFKIGCF